MYKCGHLGLAVLSRSTLVSLVWVLEHGYLVAGACVEIILVHAQIVNARIKADALHDGLVIDVACFFSAGASSASASHPLDFVLQRAVLRQPLVRWWITLVEPCEMESLAVRAHIGHCCASVCLLALLHFLCIRDELDLDFSMLPWHSMMAAVRCQVLLGPRTALSASVPPDPSSPKDLFLPPQEPDRTHALSFCVTCVLTSSHSCAVVLCVRAAGSDCLTPVSRGPDLSWDSRRAFHQMSSTATFHQGAGSSIIRHNVVNVCPSPPSLSSPSGAPVIIMLRHLR